jgi:hypothetical protein
MVKAQGVSRCRWPSHPADGGKSPASRAGEGAEAAWVTKRRRHQGLEMYHSELTRECCPEISDLNGIERHVIGSFEHNFNELIRCKNKFSTLHWVT